MMLALDEHLTRDCDRSAGRRRFDNAPLTALAGEALGQRFRSWRGRSGKRFVFSVYDLASCPAYEHAVMIVAAASPDGERRVISIADTGSFPDIVLAKAGATGPAHSALELHIHLLAQSRAERLAVIADLAHFC
jgi:hypothetical protein